MKRGQKGFSLIEVMVVVAIIAVIAAVAVPNLLPEVHKAHVAGGAEIVAAAVARARGEAMLSKRCSTTTGSVNGVPAGFACKQIVFRPNGRTWTLNAATLDDDAVINVAHPGLGASRSKNILINSNGLICVHKLGQALVPGAGPADFVCPP